MHQELERIGKKIKNVVVFTGTSLYGGICHMRLMNQSRHAVRISEKLLLDMVRKSKDTEIGKKFHFNEIRTIKDYQKKVPYTTFDDYSDYVERMVETGEQGLITADEIVYFADTSGTVSLLKKIPVSKSSFIPYVHGACSVYWLIRKEMKRRGFSVLGARGLNPVDTSSWPTKGGIRHGYISSYCFGTAQWVLSSLVCFPDELFTADDEVDSRYLKALFALAEKDLTYLWVIFMSAITDMMVFMTDNYKMLTRDIARGKIDPSVRMPAAFRRKIESKLRPDPKRAKELRAIFEHPEKGPIIPRIWQKMSVIVAIGSGEFTPYVNKMRTLTGPDIAYCYEFFAASESMIGSVTQVNDDRYLLIPDGGFYEFLPVLEDGTTDEKHPLTIREVREGEHYELVITNLSGLYRYRIKDVVRVAGFQGQSPYLQFAYRKQQVINIAGAHVTTEQIQAVIKELEERIGSRLADYSLYEDVESVPARIVFFMEPEEDWMPNTVAEIPQILDKLLTKYNSDFGHLMEWDEISPTFVRVLPKGTYRRYREERIAKGTPANQLKNVRIISKPEQLEFFTRSSEWKSTVQ